MDQEAGEKHNSNLSTTIYLWYESLTSTWHRTGRITSRPKDALRKDILSLK